MRERNEGILWKNDFQNEKYFKVDKLLKLPVIVWWTNLKERRDYYISKVSQFLSLRRSIL